MSPFPFRIAAGSLAAALLGGCGETLSAPAPMRALRDDLPGGKAKCLVVLMPGRRSRAESFLEHGFVRKFRERGLAVDVVAADATMGYYVRQTLLDRLEADVLAPARASGYEQLWLLGVSMGGFGSLLYAKERPGQATGVLLLAPFLGDDPPSEELRAAGGLLKWQAPAAAPLSRTNYELQIWRWLQAVTAGREPGPKLLLGFGTEDPFAARNGLLGEALPSGNVIKVPGAHDWPTWDGILDRFLADSEFSRACGR
ncbi:MAG: hypothetical protein A2X36_03090 [Elusimicrobia bacterium GWA2_69_24]|nr:MAG: hypothetical protein A2X36_03090 [Elusimicrobia bacterium GWA2_69_24]HBL19226.1 alpha/beta hydrolase [Elusimicrobiota bacterium]